MRVYLEVSPVFSGTYTQFLWNLKAPNISLVQTSWKHLQTQDGDFLYPFHHRFIHPGAIYNSMCVTWGDVVGGWIIDKISVFFSLCPPPPWCLQASWDPPNVA